MDTIATTTTAATASAPPLVSVQWLHDALSDAAPAAVAVLDASWYMPADARDTRSEWTGARIPGARFFDIDAVAADGGPLKLPHMLPTKAQFETEMRALGIANSTHVVVYDTKGVFAAPRTWWTFKAMGHEKVSVLNGGLPAWVRAGHSTHGAGDPLLAAAAAPPSDASPSYTATPNSSLVVSYEEIEHFAQTRAHGRDGSGHVAQVVDCRAAGRFTGEAPEPRPGLPSGHIPGSVSCPWDVLVHPDQTFLEPTQLMEAVRSCGVDPARPVTASCGSGLTACVFALAVDVATGTSARVSVYDGSWTEYAQRAAPNLIARGPAGAAS